MGGFLAVEGARQLDDVRQNRQESTEGRTTVIREPGRTIVREDDKIFIRHDETARFRELAPNVRSEQRDEATFTSYDRPGGDQIITVTDADGRLLRRVRRGRDGREVVIIDNMRRGPARSFSEDVVALPPPLRRPRDRYVVQSDGASRDLVYRTLSAPLIASVPRRYTLDEVRYSSDLRARMRSVDVDTLTFESGSWSVPPEQVGRLVDIAAAMQQAVRRNPNEVFLVEGHTDAVGSDVDNLSLSDRRAQSVATLLSREFGIPPENLTTQGYGEQFLKVSTSEAARENRRVTLRRITPLIAGPTARR